jgi:uncharacterized membrane protein
MELRLGRPITPWGTLLGLVGGAAACYFLDPDGGRRRRLLAREKVEGELGGGKLAQQKKSWERLGGQLKRDWLSIHEEHWSPRARLGCSALGLVAGAVGARRGGLLGGALQVAGLGLLLRGVSNYPMLRLVGIHGARIGIEKTVEIAAPVEEVYRYWDVEQFPRFMDRVREVQCVGPDRYHWKLSGPAHLPLEWDALVTRREPDRLLVWATEPGSFMKHVGMVRFERISDAMTRVSVHLSYDPPAGALGHAMARLFGVDPRSELDRDLSRFRKLVEARQPGARD